MRIPLDKKVETLPDMPYTIAYVVKKRQQIDSFNELPKDKRPTDDLIWDGTPEEIDDWFDRVFDKKNKPSKINLDLSEVEG